MALITAVVSCAKSQDSLLSVSVRRVHDVFPTVEFNGGGKPCLKTRETAALRRGIQKPLRLSVSFFKARISTMTPDLKTHFCQCLCVRYLSCFNSAASCIALDYCGLVRQVSRLIFVNVCA